MSDSLVLIPTYNEIGNIQNIIQAVFDLPKEFHVLVIDDNSPDGTAEVVKKMMHHHSGLFLLSREGKKGLGTAYIAGFEWALEKAYEFIFEMDADFSHPPKKLLNLYAAIKDGKADVAVGSRYIKDGKVENWPWIRLFLSYGASLYVKLITWMPVNDSTAGFVAYRNEVLKHISFEKIKFIGYAFQIEMKFAAWRLGYKIQEVPITFVDRTVGESKMSLKIFKEALLGVLKMKWRSFFDHYA